MTDWILFRVDASTEIGTGHVMRCLAVGREMLRAGVTCVFVCRYLPEALRGALADAGMVVVKLPADTQAPSALVGDIYAKWLGVPQTEDAEHTITAVSEMAQKNGPPMLIAVDHYALNTVWETRVSQQFDTPVFVIDDLSNREHNCAGLLDTTFGKSEVDYRALVPQDCHFFVGAQYALLRPEFKRVRASVLAARDEGFAKGKAVERVLVALGGADKDNATALCLEALNAVTARTPFHVDVLVGAAYPFLDKLNRDAEAYRFSMTIHSNVSDVTPLLASADLAIGAAGSSTWERCRLGVPTVNVVIAENQMTIARNLTQAGAVVPLNDLWTQTADAIASDILQLLFDEVAPRQRLSQRAREICDGEGVARVVAYLKSFQDDSLMQFKQATRDDIQTVFEWQTAPSTREHAVNPQPPTWDEHQEWMERRISDTDKPYMIAWLGGERVGFVRLDKSRHPDYADVDEISIVIAPDKTGQGLGKTMLQQFVEQFKIPMLAHVLPNNTRSHRLFLAVGFVEILPQYYGINLD